MNIEETLDMFVAAGKPDASMMAQVRRLFSTLYKLDEADRIETINAIQRELHQAGPFSLEPVGCIQWIPCSKVVANDYNPNSVAPPEMELLAHSITQDGYTQPIVAWQTNGHFEVVDGFHRNRVGRELEEVRNRVRGYLPITVINPSRDDRGDRIAATIRHNRARGKHKVDAMSDIVVELKRRNWTDEKIGRELGMEPDEVLRLCQITGLAEMFANQEFSRAWDIDSALFDEEAVSIDDGEEIEKADDGRILHTWEKWECYQHGFYEDRPPDGLTQQQGEEIYRSFLSDLTAFRAALEIVTSQWKYSCEHYLTNDRMNRIAWLGQAAVAQARRIPACCRGGYNLLSESQQADADKLALEYLNKWQAANGRPELTMDQARGRTEPNLY